MKKFIPVALLLWSATGAEPPIDSITEADIKAHMFYLASDEMAGRDAASPHSAIASNYIASEFMRLRLKPVGDNGTYFQNFDMMIASLDRNKTTLRVKIGGSEKTYEMGHEFSWTRQSVNPTTVRAPLVFAGYGVNAPEYDYNDFAGIDVRGKVVMVLSREPQSNDANSRFKGGIPFILTTGTRSSK
jgi:hypothetical protein